MNRTASIADERGEFMTLEDGFWYWEPSSRGQGCFSTGDLLDIVEELQDRNRDWEMQIAEALSGVTLGTAPVPDSVGSQEDTTEDQLVP